MNDKRVSKEITDIQTNVKAAQNRIHAKAGYTELNF
jgi:hypothetical protein